jgi:cytochrome P450
LSFGHGVHHCVGAPLARIEIVAALTALAEQVKTIEVGEPQRRINNVTRRLCGLAAQVTPA